MIPPELKVVTTIVVNDTNPHIISGNQKWLLRGDHEEFKNLLRGLVKLYPFADKPKQKTSLMCIISRKLTKRFCGKSRS